MLLTFAVTNFCSFADTAVLDLTKQRFRTNTPPRGQTWRDVTEQVAAIYGANAAGKSTFLDAIEALASAVRHPGMPLFQPSLATATAEPASASATQFEVDFVAEGVRYSYIVVACWWGISRETLYSFPKNSRRLLFDRHQESEEAQLIVDRGASLTGPTAQVAKVTRPAMLLLATAVKFGHSELTIPARGLLSELAIRKVDFRNQVDESSLRRVKAEIVEQKDLHADLIHALLASADLGILDIDIRTEEIDPRVRREISRILHAFNEGQDIDDDDLPTLTDVLVFTHQGRDGTRFELGIQRESSGTLTWTVMAWEALLALRDGATLLVDELDASLHPDLSRYIVELFLTEELNPHGAQLVFTTHDVSLLGNTPFQLLEPSQVWFVEKNREGESELFSLADFPTQKGNNIQKRYLTGQFGAVPNIDETLVERFLTAPNRTH